MAKDKKTESPEPTDGIRAVLAEMKKNPEKYAARIERIERQMARGSVKK